MSGAILQEIQASVGNGAGFIAITFANPVTQGSAIHAITTSDSSSGGVRTYSLSDNNGNGAGYSNYDQVNDAGHAQQTGHGGCVNHNSGSTTVTNVPSGNTFPFGATMTLREVGGVSVIDAHNGNETDGVTAGNNATIVLTNTNAPAFASIYAERTTNAASTISLQAPIVTDVSYFPGKGIVTGHQRIPSNTTTTFTVSVAGGTTDVQIMVALYDESAPSNATPIGGLPRVQVHYRPPGGSY